MTGTTGTTTSAFDAGVSGGEVSGIARTTSGLYLVGPFATVGGAARPGLARVSAATGAVTGWIPAVDPPSPNRSLTVVTVDEATRTVFAGGSGLNVRAYDAVTGTRADFGPLGAYDSVHTIAVVGQDIIVGGDIDVAGGVTRDGFAAIDLQTGRPTALEVRVSGGSVQDMASTGGGALRRREFHADPRSRWFVAPCDRRARYRSRSLDHLCACWR